MTASTTLIGLIASVAVLAMAAMQLGTLVRERTTAGVSRGAWGMYTLLSALWCGYAVSFGSRLQLVQTTLGILVGSALLLTIVTHRRAGLPGALGWMGASVAVGVTAAWAPQTFVTWGALAVAVAAELPQPLSSMQSLRARAITDVSRPTWVIGIVASAMWAAYGGLAGYTALLAAGVCGVAARTLTVTIETYLRRPGPSLRLPRSALAPVTPRNGTAP